MTAPRVLVVDDDLKIRRVYERTLTVAGYAVITAATADEALTIVREFRPSAVFVDLKMPFVNGAGFLFRLRQDPAGRDVLGARVWHKPLTVEEIVGVARTLLEAKS